MCRKHKSQIVSIYSPYYVPTNAYVNNVQQLLEGLGIVVLPIKAILNPLIYFRVSIINLNWYENIESPADYYKKLFLLYIFIITRKKIVYTMHNIVMHKEDHKGYSKRMIRKLCNHASYIIGMCKETRTIVEEMDPSYSSKVRIIPHPNYISNYANKELLFSRAAWDISDNAFVMLFFGAVSPYKNIELLIECMSMIEDKEIVLLVVGHASNKKYKDKIVELAKDKTNIHLVIEFIHEDYVASYFNAADIVVLPYDKRSSLNSGALVLSFSLKKTVICPRIGAVRDIKSDGFLYEYNYNEPEEHLQQLYATILVAFNDYNNDRSCIIKKGEKAYNYIINNNSNEVIRNLYHELYFD